MIDNGVLASYGPLMATLCQRSAERLRRGGGGRLAGLGTMLAAGQLAAAACDVGENTALFAVLRGGRGRLPAVARASAASKFSLLGAGVIYVALGMGSKG